MPPGFTAVARVATLVVALASSGCNAVWGLDDVDDAALAPPDGGGCAKGGVLGEGSFEVPSDLPIWIPYEVVTSLVELPESGCHAMHLDLGGQYPDLTRVGSLGSVGGQCVTVRTSARGSALRFDMTADDTVQRPAQLAGILQSFPQTSFVEKTATCRLPDPLTVTRLSMYSEAPQVDAGVPWLEIDYIVLTIADCSGVEEPCEAP